MTPILDYYDDYGKTLSGDKSELAKEASARLPSSRMQDKGSIRYLDSEFGLVCRENGVTVSRHYPLTDPNTLAVSEYYFEKTGSALPEGLRADVAKKIASAKARFNSASVGPLGDVVSYEEREKVASAGPILHKSFIHAGGKALGYTGDDQLQKLACSLASRASGMPPTERREIALQLVMAGVPPSSMGFLEKYAGLERGTTCGFGYHQRREYLSCHHPDTLDALSKIERTEDLEKQASMLNALDEVTSMNRTKIPDAYVTVFGPIKEEKPRYTPGELSKVASVLGKDVAEALSAGVTPMDDEHTRVINQVLGVQ